MKKSIKPLIVVGKLVFVVAFVAALALAVSWVAGSSNKASAATDAVQTECYYNQDEQLVCPLDTTDDKVPTDCQPTNNRVCDPDTNDQTDDSTDDTPQVLDTSTTVDPTFQGK